MHTGGVQTGSGRRRGLVLLLIGYIAVMVSLGLAYQGPDNEFTGPPTCDGQAMSPGDRCITFRFGTRTGASSTSQTYEEALASQRDGVKETPWMWGVLLGTTGTVLVFDQCRPEDGGPGTARPPGADHSGGDRHRAAAPGLRCGRMARAALRPRPAGALALPDPAR